MIAFVKKLWSDRPKGENLSLMMNRDERAEAQHAPAVDGVTLASLHAAKGLEWDAVFVVGLVDGVVPISQSLNRPAAVEEERRLLYVGMTRAMRDLYMTWARRRATFGAGRGMRHVDAHSYGVLEPVLALERPDCGTDGDGRQGQWWDWKLEKQVLDQLLLAGDLMIARREGFAVTVAACDTFRAAAIEQLHAWALRIGAAIVARQPGADAAGVAFDALTAARASGADILIIDTAGRLQNKKGLMDELAKIRRVLGRLNPAAPHNVVLVLDATTGQNGLSQIEVFKEVAGVTGLVMTKLDGTARGGVLVAAAEKFGMPIHAIGVGESKDDLRPFDARAVARAIAGLPA